MKLRSIALFGGILAIAVAGASAESPSEPAKANDNAEFDALYQQWKTLFSELNGVAIKAHDARRSDLAGYERQFDALVRQGDLLRAKLEAVARQAYAASSNPSAEIGDFLLELVNDDNFRGNYEKALQLGKFLEDHGDTDPTLYNIEHVASFAINNFDAAQKYFDRFTKNLPNTTEIVAERARLSKYVAKWERELAMRKADSQAPQGQELPLVKLTTSQGEVVLELFENQAPNTVANFISLVNKKFYDGVSFYQVVPGMFVAAGEPKPGRGPGYEIASEASREDHREHFRGTVSMAQGSSKATANTKFFVRLSPGESLDGKSTVFGRVIQGLDVLARLQRVDPSGKQAPAVTPDAIITARVIRKRDHVYEPKKLIEPPKPGQPQPSAAPL